MEEVVEEAVEAEEVTVVEEVTVEVDLVEVDLVGEDTVEDTKVGTEWDTVEDTKVGTVEDTAGEAWNMEEQPVEDGGGAGMADISLIPTMDILPQKSQLQLQ